MTRQVTSLPVIEKSVANGNWDTSRKTINRVIIHTMVGTAVSADSRFNNSTQQVSAHYGVLLDGTIWHWVDEDNTAYHAGDYAVNQSSIGIEHEDNGDYNGVRPDALYNASAKLVRDICQFYNIPIDRQHILKHSEVHPTGCPDALDIDRIVQQASSAISAQPSAQSLNDQTKIPAALLGQPQEMEIQAIRGKLGDLDRVQKQNEDYRKANNEQVEIITELRKDLQNAQQSPAFTPKSPLGKLFLSWAVSAG